MGAGSRRLWGNVEGWEKRVKASVEGKKEGKKERRKDVL